MGRMMESSFFSKAKTALHNAAAKAERLITEIKEDFKTEFGRSASPDVDDAAESLQWNGDVAKQFQERIYGTIVNFSRDEDIGFDDAPLKAQVPKILLEDNKDLENLRFEYVPKKMEEHEFWKYYLMVVDRIKQEIRHGDSWEENGSNDCQHQAESESPKKDPTEEDAYRKAMSMVVIPPSKLVRKLAAAIQVSKSMNTIKDLESLKTDKDAIPSGAFVSGLAAMKNSILRENKDSKMDEIQTYVCSLFNSDFKETELDPKFKCAYKSKFPEEIKGAPPGSFISHLAEIMGGMGSYRRMAEFWHIVILELRRCWKDARPIPRLPLDSKPDLRYCLVLQKLQVINCCMARKKCQAMDLALLDTLNEAVEILRPESMNDLEQFLTLIKSQGVLRNGQNVEPTRWFVELKDGQLLLRLGADFPAGDLKMLESGQQVYSPVTQEGPVLTEDLIEETEQLVLRTGSVGAGCSQLLSDMQAFKAANPGCILEDFVRWYSPLDWRESSESDSQEINRGRLSARMQSEGNLWQELWASAKPIPAAKQTPLFDEDLAVESTLDALEDIQPADLFEQLFKAILATGFAVAEMSPVFKKAVPAAQFKECKDFVISVCKEGIRAELDHLCQVYEMIENMLQHPPPEELQDPKTCLSPGEADAASHEKGSKPDRNLFRRLVGENQSPQGEKPDSGFSIMSRIREAKSSLFEKKSQGSVTAGSEKKSPVQENGWTLL